MELRTLSVGKKAIVFDIILNPGSTDEAVSTEERRTTAHEAPLDSLTKSFAALGAVFCQIMEVPPDWSTGLTITKITVSRTKSGTRSVKFRGKKQLDVRREMLHTVDSPMVQIDKPGDGESGEVQVDGKAVKLISKAIQEAERYANGERSQKLLNFDEDKAALNAQFSEKEPALL